MVCFLFLCLVPKVQFANSKIFYLLSLHTALENICQEVVHLLSAYILAKHSMVERYAQIKHTWDGLIYTTMLYFASLDKDCKSVFTIFGIISLVFLSHLCYCFLAGSLLTTNAHVMANSDRAIDKEIISLSSTNRRKLFLLIYTLTCIRAPHTH